MNAKNVVQELWRLSAILRKDGITYQQYVTELTYLLFLKMIHEQGQESRQIPIQYRWSKIVGAGSHERLNIYRAALAMLGNANTRLDSDDVGWVPSGRGKKLSGKLKPLPRIVHAIFSNSATALREPGNLDRLVRGIDQLHWFSEERDQFGDLYEGLLQKNAEETKRGAGQYFTPRVLINLLVSLMKPSPGEIIQDPATGTGGFLIAADTYMRGQTDNYRKLTPREKGFQKHQAFHGLENVQDTYRLLLMNLYLHGLSPDHVALGNTLGDAGEALREADLILTNPPFGPAGGAPTRADLVETAGVSSFQLPFVEHCVAKLKPGGRAAIVVPDNVLFEGRGQALRRRILRECNLHTILRLPTGIFYAQGVKTNVIFLQKANQRSARSKLDETKFVWIYDLRTGMPQYGKTNQLKSKDFEAFIECYGRNPNGTANRIDQGSTGRFRCFSRKEIAEKEDNLDISWIDGSNEAPSDGFYEPEQLVAAITALLHQASADISLVEDELNGLHAS